MAGQYADLTPPLQHSHRRSGLPAATKNCRDRSPARDRSRQQILRHHEMADPIIDQVAVRVAGVLVQGTDQQVGIVAEDSHRSPCPSGKGGPSTPSFGGESIGDAIAVEIDGEYAWHLVNHVRGIV